MTLRVGCRAAEKAPERLQGLVRPVPLVDRLIQAIPARDEQDQEAGRRLLGAERRLKVRCRATPRGPALSRHPTILSGFLPQKSSRLVEVSPFRTLRCGGS